MSFTEGPIISSFEIVLPRNVVETSHRLEVGKGAEFLASNIHKQTTSRIKLQKQTDSSVRIKLSVHAWKTIQHESIETEKLEEGISDQPQNVKIEHIQKWTEEKELPPETFALCVQPTPEKVQMLERTLESLRSDRHSPAKQKPSSYPLVPEVDPVSPTDTAGGVEQNVEIYIIPSTSELSVMDMDDLRPAEDVGEPLEMDQQEEYDGELTVDESQARDCKKDSDLEASKSAAESSSLETARDCSPGEETLARGQAQGGDSPTDSMEDSEPEDEVQETKVSLHARVTPRGRTAAKVRKELCRYCELTFRSVSNLYSHIRGKHSDGEGLEQYLDELNGLRRCTCVICNKEYSSKAQLDVHLRTMHVPLEKAKCPECGLLVKSERHLKSHIWRLHSEREQDFLCHLCPASFKVQTYLTDHLKNVHTTNAMDTFTCDECDFTCSSVKYLRGHKFRVHRGRRYPCPHCQKAFSLAPNMRRHIELVHTKEKTLYTCPECGKNFSLKSNLKEHINSIHLKRFAFKCELCNAGFRRRRELDAHQHLHNAVLADWNGQPVIYTAPLELQSVSKKDTSTSPEGKVYHLNTAATLQMNPLSVSGVEVLVATSDNEQHSDTVPKTPESSDQEQ